MYIHIDIDMPYNVKSGLINIPLLINLLLQKKSNLKTGGPPWLINRWAYPRLINHHFGNPFFLSKILPHRNLLVYPTRSGENEPKWLRVRKSIFSYPKFFPHRNLVVYPTSSAENEPKWLRVMNAIDPSHIQFFMVQSCLLLRGGQENQSEGTPPTFWGGVINPVLA